jgi:UDP-N-acetylglucosamine:LPS N-acetylglucosamine transferase
MFKMRLLIGASSSKIFHLNEFAEALTKLGIKTKVVFDAEYCDGFPSRKFKNWFHTNKKFKKLVQEFKPDVILIDRQRHFGLSAIKEKIPLLIHLRGDYWEEMKMAEKTLYKSFLKKIILNKWKKIGKKCFENSNAVIPICKYLENRTNEEIYNKETFVMYQGINPSNWFYEEGFNLEHPCVGLLQGAVIWGKAEEMFTLEKVLEELPNVKFYWVGDGPFRNEILSRLKKYENFKWLGVLEYPNKVREYLSEIDVYALISGLDMSPLTLLEAQLMEKPVIATNVGGIHELMIDKKTGFLIKQGDSDEIIKKIKKLLNDPKTMKEMGIEGRKFVSNNFSWEIIATKFVEDIKKILKK